MTPIVRQVPTKGECMKLLKDISPLSLITAVAAMLFCAFSAGVLCGVTFYAHFHKTPAPARQTSETVITNPEPSVDVQIDNPVIIPPIENGIYYTEPEGLPCRQELEL
jgi:hypothetical protein